MTQKCPNCDGTGEIGKRLKHKICPQCKGQCWIEVPDTFRHQAFSHVHTDVGCTGGFLLDEKSLRMRRLLEIVSDM